MLDRIGLEKQETVILSPYAALSKNSQGRLQKEVSSDLRTIFQRDRDRIIHSKSFRRLKHKTQVFIAPEGDHYRTRLTHTLEVAQIARTIARSLRLNEDLTEAIALGHDLGHTPFGHAGEEALQEAMGKEFNHNQQSLRVVDYLEIRSNKRRGLNLSHEVRDGILNHTGANLPSTLEGQIVRIADRIAYINHDIDDVLRAGVLKDDDLPKEEIKILGDNHSARINTMVRDMIFSSEGKDKITRSAKIEQATECLRTFLFNNVYIGSLGKKEESKAKRLIVNLFKYFIENPEQIPVEFKHKENENDLQKIVIDYVAGMTDRYAINLGKELFIPTPWLKEKNNSFLQDF